MYFVYRRHEALPRLAWCAHLERGSPQVTVTHGPWIEAHADRFFEGAWDGPFAAGRFDEATTFTGTGGIARADRVSFIAPTHVTDRLYSLRTERSLLVSSSLAFLLEHAGDEPDPAYPHYHRDLLAIFRDGTTRPDRATIHTRRGRRVGIHHCAHLAVGPDLAIERRARPSPGSPRDFAGYVDLVQGTLARVLANAADPARQRVYAPIVTLSRGYDSPAVAVLARRCGASAAVTFAGEDGGTEIGRRLGYTVTEHDPQSYRDLPGTPEAEHCVHDRGYSVPFSVLLPQLSGALALNGHYGDSLWATDGHGIRRDYRLPHATYAPGASQSEMRTRAGFLSFPVPSIGQQDAPRIHRITMSAEMRPFRVGGPYDRPIPRRLIEEAGIPRGSFAADKHAGAVTRPFAKLDPSREAHRGLLAYYAEVRPDFLATQVERIMSRAYRADAAVVRWLEAAARAAGADVRLRPHLHERWRARASIQDFTFQWAIATLRPRYRVER